MKFLSDLAKEGFSELVGTISSTVEGFTFDKDDKARFIEKMTGDLRAFELKLNENIVELERIDAERVANARALQIEALKQQSWLAKNYLYLLATVVILASLAFGIALMFYTIPEANRRTIEMFFDMFLFAGAMAVMNFFFGSSLGSKQKQEQLAKVDKMDLDETTEFLRTERQRRRSDKK